MSPNLRDWLPAPPPGPPLPRFLVQPREEDLFEDYLRDMERTLGRTLTPEERDREKRLWLESLPLARAGRPLSREDVRVEVGTEQGRLHIGIRDRQTGEYVVRWWDEEARQMFEQGLFQGFFKPSRGLEERVLDYAESVGLLATGSSPQAPLLPQAVPAEVDSELEALTAAKRREWESRGYPPGLVNRALTLATEWAAGMQASVLYRAIRGTAAEREVGRQLHRMGLDVASRWIESMARS